MSTNLSKIRREKMLEKIEEIRKYILENAANDEYESILGEISAEIRSKKYGLIFEKHSEHIDELLKNNIPVFINEDSLQINKNDKYNFLIEGDNLPALKVLQKTHKNNIDYIYIDPPYNTKSKDFVYDDKIVDSNDDFKHSKWLSFMEKRLNLAHNLLKDEGCIMISINEEELFELKILCDQIFGANNYLAMFSVKVRHEDRILKGDKDFHEVMEYLLIYRKSCKFKPVKKIVDNTSNKEYIFKIVEKNDNPEKVSMDGKEVCIFKPGEYEVIKCEASVDNLKKINIRGSIKEGNSSGRFFMKNLNKFIGEKLGYLYKVPNMGDDKFGYRYFLIPESEKRANGDYFQGVPIDRKATKEVPYANYLEIYVSESDYLLDKLNEDIHYLDYQTSFNNVGYEGYVEFRNGKKPIEFLEKCFELGGVKRNKDAIILDFFAGSGSTGHAVMKLNSEDGGNRRFILVTNNQNDICRKVTYERIKNVIEKDNYNESLMYYKTGFVDGHGKLYYEYSDELLKRSKELIQIENGIDLVNDHEIKIILSDDEMSTIINENCNFKKIYIGDNVFLDGMIIEKLNSKNIKVKRIPECYYSDIN